MPYDWRNMGQGGAIGSLWGDGYALNSGSGIMSEPTRTPQQDARLAFASQLLAGSGGNSGNFGEIMGKALLASRQARLETQQLQARQAAIQQEGQQRQQQLDQANRPPEDPSEIRTLRLLQRDPELMKLYQSMNMQKESTPASIQEWQFFQTLPPEGQAQYLNMKRQPAAPQLTLVNGVPTLVDRVNQTQTPLSTIQGESAAQGTLAEGKAVGQARGESLGGLEKKAIGAENVISKLSLADALVDIATGSTTGAAADSVAAFFGFALDGRKATAQLKILQADLMASMPRMEGPQSDRDVQLYKEATGELGDPTIPREQKKAALTTIRNLQNKYIEGGQKAGEQSASPSISRQPPKIGETRNGFRFKGGNPADQASWERL
jgi:hypothetical protein